MNVSQLTPIIQALYHAKWPGMFWGQPGIGKSYSFRAAAQQIIKTLGLTGHVLERHQVKRYVEAGHDIKQAFGVFDLRLSQCDPVDVGGLPRENKINGSTERVPPSWFAHLGRDDLPDYGILLLDELPSAPLSVQTAAYQITLDKVIDEYKLKAGWTVFAAGNRLTDGGQFFKMPSALADRLCHIDVESDLDSWVGWAIDNGVDNSLVAFMRFRPELLNTFEDHTKTKGKGFAFATERSWTAVDALLRNNPGLDDVTLQAIAGGIVGAGQAAEYMGFRQVWHRMPSVDSILIDPDSAILPEDAATQYAVLTALASRTSYDNIPNCLKYVERFTAVGRAELGMLYIRDMQRRASNEQQKGDKAYKNPVTSQAYSQWALKNKDLFG